VENIYERKKLIVEEYRIREWGSSKDPKTKRAKANAYEIDQRQHEGVYHYLPWFIAVSVKKIVKGEERCRVCFYN